MLNRSSKQAIANRQRNQRLAARLRSWAAAYGVSVGELVRYLLAVAMEMLEHGNLGGPGRRS